MPNTHREPRPDPPRAKVGSPWAPRCARRAVTERGEGPRGWGQKGTERDRPPPGLGTAKESGVSPPKLPQTPAPPPQNKAAPPSHPPPAATGAVAPQTGAGGSAAPRAEPGGPSPARGGGGGSVTPPAPRGGAFFFWGGGGWVGGGKDLFVSPGGGSQRCERPDAFSPLLCDPSPFFFGGRFGGVLW